MPVKPLVLVAALTMALPAAHAAPRGVWAVEPRELQGGARVCDAVIHPGGGADELRLRLDHAATRMLVTLPGLTTAPGLLSLAIDGVALDDLRVSGMDGGAVAAPVPLAGTLFTRMMQGRRLVVSAAGQSMEVPTAGFSGVIDRLYDCVRKLR